MIEHKDDWERNLKYNTDMQKIIFDEKARRWHQERANACQRMLDILSKQ